MLSSLLAIGCDRAKQADHPRPAPVPTLAIAPTTLPAARMPAGNESVTASEPTIALMMIDQRQFEFPPAKVRIVKTDGRVIATLYSDDPKDALDDKYRGNGFYFEMPLNVPETAFDQAVWFHHAETAQRAETPFGIFLEGHRAQLQPLDVRARFSPGVDGLMKVELSGTFLWVNTQDDAAMPRPVPVAAWLMADPLASKSAR